jgi:1,4-alpha-glucan branching enzyme
MTSFSARTSFFSALASVMVGCSGVTPSPMPPTAMMPPTVSEPDASIVDAGIGLSLDGPGAHLTAGGVLFRVWAPGARAAWVEGDFGARVELSREDAGHFAAVVPGIGAGALYRFVLSPQDGGAELKRLDPYCRQRAADSTTCQMTSPFSYPWQDAAFVRAKQNLQVVYEMHIGSFTRDPMKGYGTFQTARARLSELAELGVNVVELMPVHEFGGNPNGWGYNPQLHFAPKRSYGTADDLRAFVDEAHRLGIAVWHDAVINHHDGWGGSPLRCFDGTCLNNSAGIYYFANGEYANTPWGPRPNFSEPAVKRMFLDATRAWLTEMHGDGFRWDSTSNVRGLDGNGITPGGRELLIAQNAISKAAGATSVAEDLKGYADLVRATAQGGFGFDAQWDGFGYDVANVLVPYDDNGRDLGAISRALTGNSNGDPFTRLLFTETHDTVGNGGARLPSLVDPANAESLAARRRSMLGAALLMTAPGIPMLFMGQEGLATGSFADPPATLAPRSGAGELVRVFYKDLIALRKNQDGLTAGLSAPGVEILHRNDTAKVLIYRRYGPPGEDVIVALNFRNRAYPRYDVGVAQGGAYRIRLTSDRKRYGADFGDAETSAIETLAQPYEGRRFTLPLALGPYGIVILSR